MLTKTQLKVMQVFASAITRRFTTTEVSRIIGVDYKHVHATIKSLAEEKLIICDHKSYRLNYRENHQKLGDIEQLRSEEFLGKKKNRYVKLVISDILDRISHPSLILVLFGSTVAVDLKPHDVDILIIVETKQKAEKIRKAVDRVKSPLSLDVHVHWYETAYEMLEKREEGSLLHEVLNKHLIFHGAESFYRLLARRGR